MRAKFLVPKVLAFALVACGDTVEIQEQSDASVPDAAVDAGNCECTTNADCGLDGFCMPDCTCAFA